MPKMNPGHLRDEASDPADRQPTKDRHAKAGKSRTSSQSYDRWDEYTRARDEMFAATDSLWAPPWFVARSEDKRRVRLNVTHFLSRVPYNDLPAPKVKLPKRKIGHYKPAEYSSKFVPEPF